MIQPFDSGPFDRRYDELLVPAIEAAGFEAYRVDRDPAAVIPIERIEEGIRNSNAVVAEISEDNPNVWYELGFAIASGHEPVLLCSATRHAAGFPFDIQHRAIVTYDKESTSDFEELARRVTERLKASAERTSVSRQMSSPAESETDLEQFETAAMVIVFEGTFDPGDRIASWDLRRSMENFGFTEGASKLATMALMKKGLVEHTVLRDRYEEDYTAYSLTDSGINWILRNRELLKLRKPIPGIPSYNVDEEPF